MNISQIKLTFLSPSCTLCTTMKYSSPPALQNIFGSRLSWNPPCNVCHIPKFLALHLTNTCWHGTGGDGPQWGHSDCQAPLRTAQTQVAITAFLPRCPWESSPLPGWRKSEARSGPKNSLPTASTQQAGLRAALRSRSRTDTSAETA